jgi:hypothetical protein
MQRYLPGKKIRIMRRSMAVFLLTAMFIACKEEPVRQGKDRITLLTEQPWKLVAEYQRTGSLPIWGSNTYFPAACEADNIYRFTTSGQYYVTEGSSRCIASQPDTLFAAAWFFLQTNSIIIANTVHQLERLDDNNLELVFSRRLGTADVLIRRVFIH